MIELYGEILKKDMSFYLNEWGKYIGKILEINRHIDCFDCCHYEYLKFAKRVNLEDPEDFANFAYIVTETIEDMDTRKFTNIIIQELKNK